VLGRLAGSWWLRAAITAGILAWLSTRIDMRASSRSTALS
jgi:hypothetical protein